MENKDKILVVMGNGKSLADVDFSSFDSEHIDTFGLNGAYRQYNRMNWYPTYFGCFDNVVTNYHKDNFYNTVVNNPIEKAFFILPMPSNDKIELIKLNRQNPGVGGSPLPKSFDNFFDGGNSGVNSVQCGIVMGYKKIILIGVDCNYVEFIPEAKKNERGELVIIETPTENPNYWFNDYQQKGDLYNVPQAGKFHLPGWEKLSQKAPLSGIDIVNCSPKSELVCFRRGDLENELRK